MTVSLGEFISQLGSSPVLVVTVLLTLGVVLVNGWTDAPNAIATCVSTQAISAKAAILMAAVRPAFPIRFLINSPLPNCNAINT